MANMVAHTLTQVDHYLDIPSPRPGIYLDGGTQTMLDVGGNTACTNGQVFLTNSQARIFGRGNGAIEWINVTNTCPATTTATVKVKYNSLDGTGDWGPMGYFVSNPCGTGDTSVSTEWEWNVNGTVTKVMVYRSVYDPQSGWLIPEVPLSERLKRIIADRCAPSFIKDRKALDFFPDIREVRARQTLRRVLGEDKFRDFIRKGFVSVRGKSGKYYQIFPGHGITSVYFCGKMVERLCVVMSGNFPPTDSLIMRYLLILNNEDQFRSFANVSPPIPIVKYLPKEPDKRTLVEIFAAFKAKRAA